MARAHTALLPNFMLQYHGPYGTKFCPRLYTLIVICYIQGKHTRSSPCKIEVFIYSTVVHQALNTYRNISRCLVACLQTHVILSNHKECTDSIVILLAEHYSSIYIYSTVRLALNSNVLLPEPKGGYLISCCELPVRPFLPHLVQHIYFH